MTAAETETVADLEMPPRAVSPRPRRGWLIRRALAGADLVGLAVAFLVAVWLFPASSAQGDRIALGTETLLFLATLPGWIVVGKLYGLYDRDEVRTDHSTADDIPGVFHMVTVGAWLFFAGAWATGAADPQIAKVAVFWLGAVTLVSLARVGARAACRRSAAYLQNTIIVGAGEVGQTIARKILKHREYGLNVVGFVDAESVTPAGIEHIALLGAPERLRGLIRMYDVDRVIFADSDGTHDGTLDLIRSVRGLDVQIDVVPRFYELVAPNAGIHSVEGIPLVGLTPPRLSRSSRMLKRTMDVVLAGAGLLLLSPLLAVVALAIRLDSRGPVIFRQVRMGYAGRSFHIFKFRTMVLDAEERKAELAHLNRHRDGKMFKLDDDPRVTRLGRFLRRTCLDELPQLWNVVRGDMSLVGPRPLIPEEARLVRDWGEQRLDLRPGITGLWQVLGSSTIAFDEMVNLDYLYVTSWSLWGDLRLALRTAAVVFRRANA